MQATRDGVSRLSGEFLDRALENRFRVSQGEAEILHIRQVWLLALLFFLGYGAIDIMMLSRGVALFEFRLAILLCGLGALLIGARSHSHHQRDLVNFLALLLVSGAYVALLQRRNMQSNPQGAIMLLVVGIYMFSPGRFLLVVANGVCCTAFFWLSIAGEMGRLGGWVSHSYLIPANLLAAIALARHNRARRQIYLGELQQRRARRQLREAHRRSRELLYNALPRATAEYLQKNPGRLPARQVDCATVVFADLVRFSGVSRQVPAEQLLALLNELFSAADELLAAHRLEKIKTVGDAYMAVAGAPEPDAAHARNSLGFAFAYRRCCAELAEQWQLPLQLRVGIHSGPLVAGVIGKTRYAFDIWGETVNIASRLQGEAPADAVLISVATRQLAGADYRYGDCRLLELRGCGPVLACEALEPSAPPPPVGDGPRGGLDG